jgi:hypothetical protein
MSLGRLSGLLSVCAALLAGCATVTPESAACLARMKHHAVQVEPGFAALGYTFGYSIVLEEGLYSNRGFPSPPHVMGDALPSGRIRLRPSWVCGDDVQAQAVVAHEMAHVALQHRNTDTSGISLEWAPPRHELEADALGLKALQKAGAPRAAWKFLDCRLGQCEGRRKPAPLRIE